MKVPIGDLVSPIVTCPYCGKRAVLIDSAVVYGRSCGMIWLCSPCRAWVGIHKNSPYCRPLGMLANAELRERKKKAHAAFDPLWQGKIKRDQCSKAKARKAGYSWLAGELRIAVERCHIGEFDVDMCKHVVRICQAVGMELAEAHHDVLRAGGRGAT